VKGRLRLGLHKLRASLADLLPQGHMSRATPPGSARQSVPCREAPGRALQPMAAERTVWLGPAALTLTRPPG
jgi:hypothetical protein